MNQIILLNDIKYEGCVNLPLFKIDYLTSNIDLSRYDGLIFTSKNAIKAIDSFNEDWKNLNSYCIAPKTANVVEKLGGNVTFIGESSHGNTFANELIPILKNKRVLYVKASKTVSSLVEILKKSDIAIDELITYQTVCIEEPLFTPQKDSVIVFTAPSTIECFFKHFAWDTSYKAVVIGKTTAKYMPKNINFEVASKQSIECCVELAKQLAKN